MTRHRWIALPEDAGQRIDLFVGRQLPQLTRSKIQRLCGDGSVLVNGKRVEKNLRLKGGEEVELRLPEPSSTALVPQEMPLDIVYEDANLLVINKPKGLVVHPAAGNLDGTLVNGLLFHCGNDLLVVGDPARPGIVHRLDKLTSGLLVAAKTLLAYESLTRQMKDRKAKRIYEAVVHGNPKEEAGTIDLPIGRHPTHRKRMAAGIPDGRPARTHYRIIARFQGFCHLELELETGRTHQIRVHLSHLGYPVAGDMVYGPKKGISSLEGQCLHGRTLGFSHPSTGEALTFTSPLPPYFESFLGKLQQQ